MVYNRQILLDLCLSSKYVVMFDYGEHEMLAPLLSGIPTYLWHALTALLQLKCRCPRRKCSSQLVALKAWLVCFSKASPTEFFQFVSQRSLDPTDSWLVPVFTPARCENIGLDVFQPAVQANVIKFNGGWMEKCILDKICCNLPGWWRQNEQGNAPEHRAKETLSWKKIKLNNGPANYLTWIQVEIYVNN